MQGYKTKYVRYKSSLWRIEKAYKDIHTIETDNKPLLQRLYILYQRHKIDKLYNKQQKQLNKANTKQFNQYKKNIRAIILSTKY